MLHPRNGKHHSCKNDKVDLYLCTEVCGFQDIILREKNQGATEDIICYILYKTI